MLNKIQPIDLTADEMITLIKEGTVKRGEIRIASNSSFLSIVALLENEIVHLVPNARSSIS